MQTIKDVARYCAENIEDWAAKCDLALAHIGRHMPIDYAFRDSIVEKVEEWCDDNEVSLDFFDDLEDIAEEIVLTEI